MVGFLVTVVTYIVPSVVSVPPRGAVMAAAL